MHVETMMLLKAEITSPATQKNNKSPPKTSRYRTLKEQQETQKQSSRPWDIIKS